MGPPPSPNRDPYPYVGTMHFQGIPVLVENAPGSTRSGKSEDGSSWSVKMHNYYGEIPGTQGTDGDPVDVYVGPALDSEAVFVIHQGITGMATEEGGVEGAGWYDEDKVMFGFEDEAAALAAYQKHYDIKMPVSGVTTMTVEDLRAKLDDGELALGSAVVKAMAMPSGSGWQNIPGGHKGGWRRKTAHGWEYAYSGGSQRSMAHAHEAAKKAPRAVINALREAMVPPSKLAHRVTHAISHTFAEFPHALGALGKLSTGKGISWGEALQVTSVAVTMGHVALAFSGIGVAAAGTTLASKLAIHIVAAAAHRHLATAYVGYAGTGLLGHALTFAETLLKAEKPKGGGPETDPEVLKLATGVITEMGKLLAVYGGAHDEPDEEMEKSAKPSGGGWHTIPKGKHGGMRRRKGTGSSYEYWYPDHKPVPSHKLERDPTKASGTADIKPGELIMVGGRRGFYRWTPEHGHAPDGLTWVTSASTGEHEQVRVATVFPVRKAKARPKPPPPPPPPPRPPKGPRQPPGPRPGGGGVVAGGIPEPKGHGKVPIQGEEEAGPGATYATPYAKSRAKKGTVLHDIEHGAFMLRKTRGADDRKARQGIYIPKAQQGKFVNEMRPLVEGAARRIAKRYGIATVDTMGTTAAYEELVAGAYVGLVMATSSYTGGSAFVAHARDYAVTYATQAARTELGAGVNIPDRTMRTLSGFLASRSRARAKYGTMKPSAEQIANVWSLRKKDVYTGKLGSYADGDKIRDQGNEAVPHEPWRIKTPTGEEIGKPIPGKVALGTAMAKVAQVGKVADSEWLLDHPVQVIPGQRGSAITAGEALHIRGEVEDILADMKPPKSTVLEMAFGLHDPKARQATLDEIAEHHGLAEGKSAPTRRRAAKAILDDAVSHFKLMATARRAEARHKAESWAAAVQTGGRPGPVMRSDMLERFGTMERVLIYESAIRAGEASHVGGILDAEVAGEAKAADSAWARRMHMRQRDKERLAEAAKFPKGVMDPETARPWGSEMGTPAGSDWLYPDTILSGYMVALAKRGAKEG
ncbi:MAG: hypothetical protein CMB99_01460 [Flavobacteriaceae bacterium]|nr:hypothetical protein [Flavobacteriaceae bacterium]